MTDYTVADYPVADYPAADYTPITELPGSGLTSEQWARIHHRYTLACDLAPNRRTLEVACGAGSGLPALARHARFVVGGDYTPAVLARAQEAIQLAGGTVALAQFDAQRLPFAEHSFDLILFFEAVYYLQNTDDFLKEARRVLAPGGTLLLGTENPDWPEFMPGKLSTRYLNIPELYRLLLRYGFDNVDCFGAFPVTTYSRRQQWLARLRRYLLRRGWLPNHPALRRYLQRLGYGTLYTLPPFLEADQLIQAPVIPLSPTAPTRAYKVFYLRATASRP